MNRRAVLSALAGWLLMPKARGSKATASASPATLEALIAATARLIDAKAARFAGGTRVPWSDPGQRRRITPSSLPVLRHLPACVAAAPPDTRELAQALARVSDELAWQRSYSAQATGARFFDNYGFTELAGLAGPVPSRELAAGFLLLGPGVEYPAHHHEARELYLPLAGRASWWQAGSGWRVIEPGEPLIHERWEPHAMRTGAEPMLALYLWRSANLDQHSRLMRGGR